MYYSVVRTIKTTETCIVKADSETEAFVKAGLNENCAVLQSRTDKAYEPEFNTIKEVAYVSKATKDRIG